MVRITIEIDGHQVVVKGADSTAQPDAAVGRLSAEATGGAHDGGPAPAGSVAAANEPTLARAPSNTVDERAREGAAPLGSDAVAGALSAGAAPGAPGNEGGGRSSGDAGGGNGNRND